MGRELSKHNFIIITGAADGIPYQVALTAAKLGSKIWGFAPATFFEKEKIISPQQDLNIYQEIFYIPQGFTFAKDIQVCRKYRNVTSTANCDAGIIISGRWGTMNEFTNLYDMGKVIGVLTGTGGIADELSKLIKKIHKTSKTIIVFNDSPKKLIDKIINELNKRKICYNLSI